MIGWARARLSIATCTAPIRARSKTKDAETAIRTLVKRGDPVTFQAVQREAGVSHSFLYTHPSLRERIEHLRHRNPVAPRPAPDIGTGESNLVLVLTAEVARLKKQLRRQDPARRTRPGTRREPRTPPRTDPPGLGRAERTILITCIELRRFIDRRNKPTCPVTAAQRENRG
jgi:hypothetical protein